jgi:hypothetical protein
MMKKGNEFENSWQCRSDTQYIIYKSWILFSVSSGKAGIRNHSLISTTVR